MPDVNLLTLPEAARKLGRGEHSLRWLFRQRPDLHATMPRLGGRMMIRPEDLERIRATLAARTRKRKLVPLEELSDA